MNNKRISTNMRQRTLLLLVVAISVLTSCSSLKTDLTNTSSPETVVHETTGWKAFNRDAYRFNTAFDNGDILKPIAVGYKKAMPEVVDKGISNFFSNLQDVPDALNALLQFKPTEAATDTGRFLLNSTIGVAGIFDVATSMNLSKHDEDFGQTLAKWGVPSGAYVMLPVFGPSTLRDSVGKVVDSITNPYKYFKHSNAYRTVDIIDKRASFLAVEDALKNISDDEYIALREGWLQKRRYAIADGKSSKEKLEQKQSLIDELEALE